MDRETECMDTSSSNKIAVWENVIAELCTLASDDTVKDCLRKYDPSKTTKELIQVFKKIRVDPLLKTLNFLGHFPDKIPKNELVDAVLLRIKNFFPDICGICEKEYCVKINDDAFLACAACGQEAHKDCYMKVLEDKGLLSKSETGEITIINIPGFHFLCNSCEEEITLKTKGNKQTPLIPSVHENQPPDDPNSISDVISSKESTEPIKDLHLHIEPNVIISSEKFLSTKDQGKDNSRTGDSVTWENEHEFTTKSTSNPFRTEFMRKKHMQDNEKRDKITSFSQHATNGKNPKTCRHFVKGNCNHGITGKNCKYNHPKLCRKLMKFGTNAKNGCNKSKHCEFFHPKMCPTSITKLECFDDKCQFYHVKRTKRKRESGDPSTRNISQSHSQTTRKDHFLEVVHLMRTEMRSMDKKIESVFKMWQSMPTNPTQMIQHHPPIRSQCQQTNSPMNHPTMSQFQQINSPQTTLPPIPNNIPQNTFHHVPVHPLNQAWKNQNQFVPLNTKN